MSQVAERPAGATSTARSGPPRAASRRDRGETRDAYLFLAPYLLLFTVFVLLPIGLGIWISLHAYDYSLPRQPFVGLDNYTGLLGGSSPYAGEFWSSMAATWLFTGLTVPLLLVIPLLVALVMNQRFRGRTVFRGCTSRRTCWASRWLPCCGATCSTPTSGSSTTTSGSTSPG